MVDLIRKDLNFALDVAKRKDVQASTPLGSLVSELYDMIAQRGFGIRILDLCINLLKTLRTFEEDLKSYGA